MQTGSSHKKQCCRLLSMSFLIEFQVVMRKLLVSRIDEAGFLNHSFQCYVSRFFLLQAWPGLSTAWLSTENVHAAKPNAVEASRVFPTLFYVVNSTTTCMNRVCLFWPKSKQNIFVTVRIE